MKVGFNNAWGHHENTPYALNPYSYVFTGGRPLHIRQWAIPYTTEVDVDARSGDLRAGQMDDRPLHDRGGIRFDYFSNSYPPQTIGPGTLVPGRNLVFDEGTYDAVTGLPKPGGTPNGKAVPNLSWKDITPRLGFTWDIFGNGRPRSRPARTSTSSGSGRSRSRDQLRTSSNNPINRLVNNVTRDWLDPTATSSRSATWPTSAANGECGPVSNPNFGLVTAPTTTYDPDYLSGWGKRNYNWEFSVGVQHEIMPRVSTEVSYFSRVYGNYTVADNRAVLGERFHGHVAGGANGSAAA